MGLGNCTDVSIAFVNDTGLEVDIPREGHRVKNPGGLEGFHDLKLGTSINNLAPGSTSQAVQQDLKIKCVEDATFEIDFSSSAGNFTQPFEDVDISNKNITLTLTFN